MEALLNVNSPEALTNEAVSTSPGMSLLSCFCKISCKRKWLDRKRKMLMSDDIEGTFLELKALPREGKG